MSKSLYKYMKNFVGAKYIKYNKLLKKYFKLYINLYILKNLGVI